MSIFSDSLAIYLIIARIHPGYFYNGGIYTTWQNNFKHFSLWNTVKKFKLLSGVVRNRKRKRLQILQKSQSKLVWNWPAAGLRLTIGKFIYIVYIKYILIYFSDHQIVDHYLHMVMKNTWEVERTYSQREWPLKECRASSITL